MREETGQTVRACILCSGALGVMGVVEERGLSDCLLCSVLGGGQNLSLATEPVTCPVMERIGTLG